ncbi:MAG: PTS sugar transporter subunit IIA [Pasteurellaceae bacterium]|nr:PTS sugar transporter subunit IIA [Pasteurellaceae bacterium]
MKLTEFLQPEQIHQGVFLSSKKRALEYIGKLVAEQLNQQYQCPTDDQLCAVACFSQLFKREKLGTTALNHGVALPHAKLPNNAHITLDKPFVVFVQLEMPIDYDAEDHKEVDLIYAILFPEQSCAAYKSGLADLAERLNDKNLLKQLRSATSADDIWHILFYADQHFDELNQQQQEQGQEDGIRDH